MESETISGNDEYEISTDNKRLDLGLIHDFLANGSYWARGIPFETVKRSVEHSLCFGVFHHDGQVGFARVVTDSATFAYLGDVFILEAHRGKGLGKWLLRTVLGHPDLARLRMISLGTRDAHGLYERYGFKRIAGTDLVGRLMVIENPNAYGKKGP
jgi:GNAT superfamily N-acetyltransferase